MKKLLFLSFIFSISIVSLFAAKFSAGDKIDLTEVEYGDYYVAGSEISVKTVIEGDLIITGGEITIKDSILGDILAGGGKIWLDGYVSDDARIAGGEITINGTIRGDLVVFGGKITVTENGEILGDIICFGGQIEINGVVFGDLKIAGGEIELNNDVEGDAEIKGGKIYLNGLVAGDLVLSTEELSLGESAKCDGTIRYWTGEGEIDLSKVGKAEYDESLAREKKDTNWTLMGAILGVGFIAYWMIFIVSAFLLLLFLQQFMGKYFVEAVENIRESFVKSFGYGMLYFIAVPIASLILILTIVGLPIGILTIGLFGLSMLFSTTIAGLAISHYFEKRSGQKWTYFQNIGYALLTVVILKVIFLIPLLGSLVKVVVLAAVYGAFLMLIIERQKKSKSVD